MKLIRLVSTNPEGIFDNDFNSDIKIMENSKIAIQSLSMEVDNSFITIDNNNDLVEYNITNGTPANVKQVRLAHAIYDNTNFDHLLEDIELKINRSFTLGGKNIGSQVQASSNHKTKKINIHFGYSPKQTGMFFDAKKVSQVVDNFSKTPGDADSTDDSARMTSGTPFSKGCGVLRIRIRDLTDSGGNPSHNGFEIGLSSDNPSKYTTTTITNKLHRIMVQRPQDGILTSINGGGLIQHGHTLHHHTLANLNTNDILEIALAEGQIRLNLYQDNQGAVIELASHNLTDEELVTDLFPYISFRGTSIHAQINKINTFYDPFKYSNLNANAVDFNDDSDLSAYAPPIPRPPNNLNTIYRLKLNESLREFLGYEQIENFSIFQVPSFNFEAEKIFTATLLNDNYVVELLNIDLESYDGREGKRRNILAVIPENDNNGIIEYEPSTPYFLDMKNEKKNIREIRARILRGDGEKIQTAGLSVLTLLIKCPND